MKILLAGNCEHDNLLVRRSLEKLPEAEFIFCETADEVVRAIQAPGVTLAILNRVFFHTDELGLDLITRLRREAEVPPPIMLLSNFPDAQEEAVRRGAVPGFGKSEISGYQVPKAVWQALNLASQE